MSFRWTLSIAVLLPAASVAQGWDSSSTRTIAPGVIHRRVVLTRGPWHVNVLEVDLRQPGIGIRGVKAKDAFTGRETVRAMAARYAGPGVAIAAINADFFDIRSGESENNVVIEGAMSKGVTVSDSPYDTFDTSHSQFGIDWSNRPYIDRFGLAAAIVSDADTVRLDGLNSRPPGSDALALYTAAVGDSSPTDSTPGDRAILPLRLVSRTGNDMVFRAAGPVRESRRAGLAAGGALVARGARRAEVRALAGITGPLTLTIGLQPDRGALRTVVGGWPRIVRDGRSVAENADSSEGTFPRFSSGRHPRTAIGISKDSTTLYLVTVDGRRESDSGMSLVELAHTMIQLGAHDAMNLDGGGSTTMVVAGTVVNRPSDPAGERPVGSALLVVVGDVPRKTP